MAGAPDWVLDPNLPAPADTYVVGDTSYTVTDDGIDENTYYANGQLASSSFIGWNSQAAQAIATRLGLNSNPLGPPENRATKRPKPTPPPPPGPPPAPGPSGESALTGTSTDASVGWAGNAGMGRGGPGGAPTASGCDDAGGDAPGGMWLYHGSPAIFDLLDVATAIATQAAASEYKMPELGPGIYFTDDSLRAAKYTANKLIGRVYRAWAPRDLLDRLPHKKISTNESEQYVVSDQADADILNRTLQSAPAYQVILNGGRWPDSTTC